MTRINCIPPQELCREHLVAEYRELPRLFGLVRAAAERGERRGDPRNPKEYTLGPGHVRFFYDKLAWALDRQWRLYKEMKARGYRPSFKPSSDLVADIPVEFYRWWTPTEKAMALNRARIEERMPA